MTQRDIKDTLTRFKEGKLSLDEAVLALKEQPFVDLGFAKYDSHRALRQGAGEVIYGAGKTMDEAFGLIETVEKAAELYLKTAHLPRVNTITDEQLKIIADGFHLKAKEGWLDL